MVDRESVSDECSLYSLSLSDVERSSSLSLSNKQEFAKLRALLAFASYGPSCLTCPRALITHLARLIFAP